MVHVPFVKSVAADAVAATVQIDGVIDIKPTERPDVALAARGTGTAVLIVCGGIAGKLIV